jgi:large subunit ribosomal protein L19
MNVIEKIQQEQIRTDLVPFNVGDNVKVHTRIKEGDRERIQVFSGIVINKQGRGLQETFTVRRISYGEGVERIFPTHSPFIQKVEVERAGSSRRAKLYYLRKRVGKTATKVGEA